MKKVIDINNNQFDFDILVNQIQQTNNILQQEVFVAINKAITSEHS